jgi:hypothetical protein
LQSLLDLLVHPPTGQCASVSSHFFNYLTAAENSVTLFPLP